MKIKPSIIYLLFWLLPKNSISMLMGRLVSIQFPKKINLVIIKTFAKLARANVQEAEYPLEFYPSLQDFFIRKLRPEARPLAKGGNLVLSPCDGTIGEFGPILEGGRLRQIKGQEYSLKKLLADEALSKKFFGGHFITIYLAPKDYHRFHAPLDATIFKTYHVPGQLWPVNNWGIKNVSELFCINERIISLMKHGDGTLAYIPVGATMVGKIKLNYSFLESNIGKEPQMMDPKESNLLVKAGDELGKFMFGSTIVLLFSPHMIKKLTITPGQSIKMGMILGELGV